MSSIGYFQLRLIKEIKFFFNSFKKEKNDIFRLDYFYLCPYGASKGTSRLIFFFKKFLSLKIYITATIKDIYKILRIGEFFIVNLNQNKKYNLIVFNWGELNNFDHQGNFHDKHFNVSSSKCPNVLWVIIYLNNKIPKKIGKNITLICNFKQFFNIKIILKIIFFTIFKKKNFRFFNQEFSYLTLLSNFFLKNTRNFINKNTQKVLMPYEGQPFQNAIFNKIHTYNKKIMTVGYVHSFPSGLPSNYIKRFGCPKKIIVAGEAQKLCFIKYLGWKKKEIQVLPSSRYLKVNKNRMKNSIYLPINFTNNNLIISSLKEIMMKQNIDLCKHKIKIHPHCLNSKKHQNLLLDIKSKIKNLNSSKELKKKDTSVFIGATASVIEALERGVDVYHICEIPEIEAYDEKVWKYLKSERINKNIFKYRIEKKNKLINFGKSLNLYKSYFSIIT